MNDNVTYYPYQREANAVSLSRLLATELDQNDPSQYEKATAQFKKEEALFQKSGHATRADTANAVALVGVCQDMCPRYQRLKRVYTKDVDPFEIDDQGRFGPGSAVKKFRRPAAGADEDIPSTVRPPHVLLATLEYLVSNFAHSEDILRKASSFLRDRTRSVRQDLAVQQTRCATTIECYERIARLHILVLYCMAGTKDFDMHGELEQLSNTLKSLEDLYQDIHNKDGVDNIRSEAEFQSYIVISQMFDSLQNNRVRKLPQHVRDSYNVQFALRLHGYAQFRGYGPMGPNMFHQYIQAITDDRPGKRAPFLLCCLAYVKLGQIRKNALKAIRYHTRPQHTANTVAHFANMLAVSIEEFLFLANTYHIEIRGQDQEAYVYTTLKSGDARDFNDDATPPQPWDVVQHLAKMRPIDLMTSSHQIIPLEDIVNASAKYTYEIDEFAVISMTEEEQILEQAPQTEVRSLKDLELPFDHSARRNRYRSIQPFLTVIGPAGPSSRFGSKFDASFFARQKELERAKREQGLDELNGRPSAEDLPKFHLNVPQVQQVISQTPAIFVQDTSSTSAPFGQQSYQQPTASVFSNISPQQPLAPPQTPFGFANSHKPVALAPSNLGFSGFQQPAIPAQADSGFWKPTQAPAPPQTSFANSFQSSAAAHTRTNTWGFPPSSQFQSSSAPFQSFSDSNQASKSSHNDSITALNDSAPTESIFKPTHESPNVESAFTQPVSSVFQPIKEAIAPAEKPPTAVPEVPKTSFFQQPAASIFDKPASSVFDKPAAPSIFEQAFKAPTSKPPSTSIFDTFKAPNAEQPTARAPEQSPVQTNETPTQATSPPESPAQPKGAEEPATVPTNSEEVVEDEESDSGSSEQESSDDDEKRRGLPRGSLAFGASILNEARQRREAKGSVNGGFKRRIIPWVPIPPPEGVAGASATDLEDNLKSNMVKLRIDQLLERQALRKSQSGGQVRNGSVRLLALSSDPVDPSERWYRQTFGTVHQYRVGPEPIASAIKSRDSNVGKRDISGLIFGCSVMTVGTSSFETRLWLDMHNLRRQVREIRKELTEKSTSLLVVAYRIPGIGEITQRQRLEEAVNSLDLPASIIDRRVILLSNFQSLRSLADAVLDLIECSAAAVFPPIRKPLVVHASPNKHISTKNESITNHTKRQREESNSTLHSKKRNVDRSDLIYDWGRPADTGVRKLPVKKVAPADNIVTSTKGFKVRASALDDLISQMKATFDAAS